MSKYLSIIIPIYNSQKYLKSCLDSVCKQIAKKQNSLEVILIDDASNDNSKKICMLYKKKFKFIKYFYNKTNLGVSLSRNKGIKNSNGKYILFLDSDDKISNKGIKYILAKIKNEKNFDYCFFKSKVYSKNEIDHNQVFQSKKNLKSFFTIIRKPNNFRATCWNFLIQTEYLKKNKLFFKNIRVFEDQLFVTKLLMYSKNFTVLNKAIYERRIDEPQTLSSLVGYPTVSSSFKILEGIISILNNNKSRNKKLDKFLISRINYISKQLIFNLLICSSQQIKSAEIQSHNLNSKYSKIPYSKFNLSIIKSLQIIKKFKIKNFLQKYKDKKLFLIEKFLKRLRDKKVLVFCAGFYSRISIRIIKKFKYEIPIIIDNNNNYLNKKLENILIKDLNFLKKNLKKYNRTNILICNQNYSDYVSIKQNLLDIGVKKDNVYYFQI